MVACKRPKYAVRLWYNTSKVRTLSEIEAGLWNFGTLLEDTHEGIKWECFSVSQYYCGNQINSKFLMNSSHGMGIILQGGAHVLAEPKVFTELLGSLWSRYSTKMICILNTSHVSHSLLQILAKFICMLLWLIKEKNKLFGFLGDHFPFSLFPLNLWILVMWSDNSLLKRPTSNTQKHLILKRFSAVCCETFQVGPLFKDGP